MLATSRASSALGPLSVVLAAFGWGAFIGYHLGHRDGAGYITEKANRLIQLGKEAA